jgi:hypothetical protein
MRLFLICFVLCLTPSLTWAQTFGLGAEKVRAKTSLFGLGSLPAVQAAKVEVPKVAVSIDAPKVEQVCVGGVCYPVSQPMRRRLFRR